jgi:hypothetical protein
MEIQRERAGDYPSRNGLVQRVRSEAEHAHSVRSKDGKICAGEHSFRRRDGAKYGRHFRRPGVYCVQQGR